VTAVPHDFEAIRTEFELPPSRETDRFPAEVLTEAASIAAARRPDVEDATDIRFVTIDPPGAKDLDQAVFLERVGDGFRVLYAIADLGGSIPPGGGVDGEARRRGQTVYLPDGRVPLHPPVLSEGTLSLLPDQVRSAAVWTIDVDASGTPTHASVRRALVKSVAQLSYQEVQASFDEGSPHPSIEAIADLGRLRQTVRVGLGAVELALPEEEIVRDGGDWRVHMRTRTAVDAWNAEISLLTGMSAAQLMLGAGIGVLRTLPAPDEESVSSFLRAARTLQVPVPDEATPAQVLAGLDPAQPSAMALMTGATRLLRGADYESFVDTAPKRATHAGVGGPYAHVTAPLRRLVDRFGTEVCLAICEGRPVPEWVKEALPTLPEIMRISDQRASKLDRTCIDQVEVWMLADRRGEVFDALVLHANGDGGEVMLLDPPVIARCEGAGLREGTQVAVRLDVVDETRRQVVFGYDQGVD
jgi:exoribonuclease R